MMSRRISPIALLLATLALSACVDDPVFPDQPLMVTQVNLPTLIADGCYELWLTYPPEFALVDSTGAELVEYVSAGRFLVTASGTLQGLTGGPADLRVPAGYNPALLGACVVSVERIGTPAARPGAVLLAGQFNRSSAPATATLTLLDTLAFGPLFGSVDSVSPIRRQGFVSLETPSSLDTSDWMRGLWFALLNPDPPGTVRAGLLLPAQPSNLRNPGWRYGAWLVPNAAGRTPIFLGTFDTPNLPDDDGAGPLAGPGAGFPYPGSDLVDDPSVTDLRGAFGVVVDLQPRAFRLRAPLLPVLSLDTIPLETVRFGTAPLRVPADLPIVEVSIVP